MPDFRNLEAFYWVAQLSSFRRAAQRLGLTQSAVSQRVSLLETQLGILVLERGRATVPTMKGRQVLEYADKLLRLRSDLLASVATPEALAGVLRLGVAETIVHTWLSHFIERAHALYPAVQLDIEVDVTPRLRQGLMEQHLDLAFLLGPVNEARMLNLDLCRYPLAFVASPMLYLPPEPVPLEALVKVPIITYPRTTAPYMQIDHLTRRPDLPPPRIFGNSSLSTIVRMTRDRIGISVIPPAVVRQEIEAGELRPVHTELVLPDLMFTATWSATPDNLLSMRLAHLAREIASTYTENDKIF